MDRRAFLSAVAACSVLSASAHRVARAQTMPRFYEAARYSAERGGASFLVARHGVILSEDYPGGPHDARWPIGAGTRALAPLLAASLVNDRRLSLDEPLMLTLPEWGEHPIKSAITLRTLLGGTAALAFARGQAQTLENALALEPRDTLGQSFHDDAAIYLLLAEIARRKLAGANAPEADPARYLTARTLAQIGCTPIGWTRRPDGAPRFDDGAAVSARGWAGVGELIRRQGVWRAQQLADADTLRDALRGSFAESRAGMGLWLMPETRARSSAPFESDLWGPASPAPLGMAMAAGAQGQRLYIAPAEGLVIARQTRALAPFSDAQFLSLLWRDL